MTEKQTDEYFEIIYKPKSSTFSGDYLRVIPTDPNFVPTKEHQRKLMNYLASKYPDKEIKSTLNKTVEFIDSGSNFESLVCNVCGQNMEIEDWQNAMDRAYQNSFTDLTFRTSCCDNKTSLNELNYDKPMAFSKYLIEIVNPEIANFEQDEFLKNINSLIGQKTRLIWTHY